MSLVAAVVAGMSSVSAQAADGISILENIKVKGEIRPRYEMVDTNNNTGNANAVTNRLVLGVGADIAGSKMFSVYGEMTDVHAVNPDNYNGLDDSNPNNKNVVADPEQTRLTQAYLDIKGGGALLRSGRQMINLDNQRFVGAVGWRQMPQTFDGFLAAYTGVENLHLAAAYLTSVNRVFAPGGVDNTPAKPDELNTKTIVLHAQYKVADYLTVTAYDYMLGAGTGDNSGATNGVGSDTMGIALTGKPKLSDSLTLNYRAEYAVMVDPTLDSPQYRGTNDGYDADYYNLVLGMNMSGILAGINYEYQSGKATGDTSTDNKTFKTALGTNHKFNGWADVFLSTPVQGLEDLNLMVGYKSKQVGVLKAVYHEFTSAEDSIDYGKEIDLLYKRAIPGVKNLTGMLKYADYSADDSAASGNPKATDVQKFWVMLDYKFSN